jgi:hypothetical protein
MALALMALSPAGQQPPAVEQTLIVIGCLILLAPCVALIVRNRPASAPKTEAGTWPPMIPGSKPPAAALLLGGGAIGAVSGVLAGIHLFIPAAVACLAGWGLSRILKPTSKPMLPAIAILIGHAAWMTLGYTTISIFYVPSQAAVSWLWLDIILLCAAAAWLAIRPGPLPAIILSVLQAFALMVNGATLSSIILSDLPKEIGLPQPLIMHAILRLGAMVAMAAGLAAMGQEPRPEEQTAKEPVDEANEYTEPAEPRPWRPVEPVAVMAPRRERIDRPEMARADVPRRRNWSRACAAGAGAVLIGAAGFLLGMWYQSNAALPRASTMAPAVQAPQRQQPTNPVVSMPQREQPMAPAAQAPQPAAMQVAGLREEWAAETRQLNKLSEWTVVKGAWEEAAAGGMRGKGDCILKFKNDLPRDFFIEFSMNVVDGMRPRVYFDGTELFIGNEGYVKQIEAHNGDAMQSTPFPYRNNQVMRLGVKMAGKSFEFYVDGKRMATGQRRQVPQKTGLRISGGDYWSRGTTEFGKFRIGPVE